jgi:hypothetical protein
MHEKRALLGLVLVLVLSICIKVIKNRDSPPLLGNLSPALPPVRQDYCN